MQWLYEAFYSAIGELFADINNLGVEIFDLSWVQAMVNLFTIAPTTIKFYANYFLVGDTYRCVWVIREYPPSTEEQAILAHLADHSGVTLRIYNRLVEAYEQRQIANNATRKNRLKLGDTDINESVQAEQNLLDVQQLLVTLSREKQPLIHCAVFLELKTKSMSALESLQSDISMELTRSKITADRLTLRQKEGFLSAMPFGFNCFGSQFERVLPASAVGNMFPFNFSGKTDPKGFYIGRDKYGTNILVDLDRRGDDKTNSNVLILGNSGQGKSYLMKLLLTNLRESGKRVLVMDAEGEYGELAVHNGGCCLDFLDGQYMINILEPKVWASEPVEDPDAPEAFRRSGRISQHIAFLKDWFRSYKDFTDAEVDTIEIMLSQLYKNFGLTEKIDFTELHPEDYPILSDLYELCIQEYHCYDPKRKPLYTEETLRNICLGLNSVCVGSESRFFNGHTNIQDNMFLVFGVKGVMDLNKKAICDIGSENAMPMVTGQNRTTRSLPGGFVRRWKIITLLLPTRWEVNTSGGRGWSRAVRKRIDCTPWRQFGAMHMHSTSLEGCTGMVSGQGLIWKTPSGGMPKHTQDFSPWKRLWQTISSAIALAP